MAVIGPDTPGKVWGGGFQQSCLSHSNPQHTENNRGNQHKQWSSVTLGLICRQTTTS